MKLKVIRCSPLVVEHLLICSEQIKQKKNPLREPSVGWMWGNVPSKTTVGMQIEAVFLENNWPIFIKF